MICQYDAAIYIDPGLTALNPLREGHSNIFSWMKTKDFPHKSYFHPPGEKNTNNNYNHNYDSCELCVKYKNSHLSTLPLANPALPIRQTLHRRNVALLSEFAREVLLTDSPRHLFDIIAHHNIPDKTSPTLLICIDATQYYPNSVCLCNTTPIISARSIISQIYVYFHHLSLSIIAIAAEEALSDTQLYAAGVDFISTNPIHRSILQAAVAEKEEFLATKNSHVDRIKLRVGLGLNKHRQNLLRLLVIDPSNDLKLLLYFDTQFHISQEDIDQIKPLIYDWNYDPFSLSYRKLMIVVYSIFAFMLKQPSLKHLHLEHEELVRFLIIIRDNYHHENSYHNFRHACDVLQAIFIFLSKIGCIPNYFGNTKNESSQNPPFTLEESLVLLIAALGHDISHPGVTNAFLVNSNSPMAQMFTAKSVLESYHASLLNQLLSIFWPQTLRSDLKTLIIESILATDMAHHFEYIEKWQNFIHVFKEKQADSMPMDMPSKLLIGSMIMKCADISNVTRKLQMAEKWGVFLQKEFCEANDVEADCKIRTLPQNFAKDTNLANMQVSFVSLFAAPLFNLMQEVYPEFEFYVNILSENMRFWKLAQH